MILSPMRVYIVGLLSLLPQTHTSTHTHAGKATSNFQKDLRAEEELCFSLVTQKTTLDLETRSKLERDSLARGFQISVDRVKGAV